MPVAEETSFFRGVDRAALAASFGDRLRRAGAAVPTTALADLCAALGVAPPLVLDDLYWSMRVTLVRRQPDLETFDRVFAAVFEAERGIDPHARRQGVVPEPAPPSSGPFVSVPGRRRPGDEQSDSGVPWQTLPRIRSEEETPDDLTHPWLQNPLPGETYTGQDIVLPI